MPSIHDAAEIISVYGDGLAKKFLVVLRYFPVPVELSADRRWYILYCAAICITWGTESLLSVTLNDVTKFALEQAF